MTVKAYDPIIATLYARFLANPELVAALAKWGGTHPAVYPQYITSVANPVYPSLTICMDASTSAKSGAPINRNKYLVHGWSKNNSDECAYLMNMVIDTLENVPSELLTCRKTFARCQLYDDKTLTHYFSSEWLIYSPSALIYA